MQLHGRIGKKSRNAGDISTQRHPRKCPGFSQRFTEIHRVSTESLCLKHHQRSAAVLATRYQQKMLQDATRNCGLAMNSIGCRLSERWWCFRLVQRAAYRQSSNPNLRSKQRSLPLGGFHSPPRSAALGNRRRSTSRRLGCQNGYRDCRSPKR